MNRPRRARRGAGRGTRRLAALGALVSALVLGAGVAAASPSASGRPAVTAIPAGARYAAPSAPGTTATTVTTGDRTLAVTVSPYQDLPPSGAQITVTGTGYDPANDLWIAVCQADGVAPMALINCVGGAIPDENTTTGWGVVTGQGKPPYPGPVTARWKDGGSFSLTLQMPAVISESADCVSAPCAVYTRSSDDADRSEDVAVPVTFTAPPATTTSSSPTTSSAPSTTITTSTTTTTSSSPTTTAQPSTQTLGPVPTTVTPDSMLQTSVVAGAPQTVVFTGFQPGEKVDVTLYSDPVTLPQVTADPGGNVRISFDVPKDLPPGEHLLQAIGQKSGRVGIARFTVGAAPATATSASPTTSTSAGPSPSTQTLPASSVVTSQVPSTTASLPATTSAAAPGTAASSAAAAPGAGGGNKLLWLWIALGVLVVVGGAAGAVAMARNRRETEEEIPLVAAGAPPPPAPGWGAGSPAGGTAGGPAQAGPDVPTGGFGLLSGREHPDGPGLYGGGTPAWPDQPTRVLGPEGPTQVMGPGATPGPGGRPGAGADQGPPTQQWRPDFTGQQPGGAPGWGGPAGAGADQGPATQQWRPDFTGQQRPDVTGQQPPQDGDESREGRHHR